jgi:aryl-phospho-beta-D-glucosidase BglC (GH1 family)
MKISDIRLTTTLFLFAASITQCGSPLHPASPPNQVLSASLPDTDNDDWLHVEGHSIVDQKGRAVWLTGTNWFGFNTGTNAFDGLWAVNLEEAVAAIAEHGFNILRVPLSVELVDSWRQEIYPAPRSINTYVNPELEGKNSLEVFERLLNASRQHGLKLLIDMHSPNSEAMGHIDAVWYKGDMTVEKFYRAWEWLAERYKDNDTIVAFDLKNEPHGKPYQDGESAIWDNSANINNWKKTAETAALRILAIHPRVLVLVEGVEAYPMAGKSYASRNEKEYYSNWWGGNLRGVADQPVDLGFYQSQLVYSPHDYGPAVFKQPWFYEGFDKDTLYKDVWRDNWAFIMEQDLGALLIGEWGGFMDGGDNEKWLMAIRDFIGERFIHHTFWCFNANSGDTGGLVEHDFKTWDLKKYALVRKVLWQDRKGRFVGLDHKIPLGSGKNGTTVTQYYDEENEPPRVSFETRR